MTTPRILITAGPTHEPIDAVRFLGNRSSGSMGVALGEEAASRGWGVTLLLGPAPVRPEHPGIELHRFVTAADLERLLREHAPRCDALIMAAAVADFRPTRTGGEQTKLKRGDGPMTLHLEPTPDLIAGVSATRRPGQVIAGFALEPRESMIEAARGKLERKGLDLIVANPLETMDAPDIEATILAGRGPSIEASALPPMPKPAFARELIDTIARLL